MTKGVGKLSLGMARREPNGLCHEDAGDIRKAQSLSVNTTMATKPSLVDHVAQQLF